VGANTAQYVVDTIEVDFLMIQALPDSLQEDLRSTIGFLFAVVRLEG
jgi:hypothetical protein